MLSKLCSSGKHGFESHRKGKERSKHNLWLIDIYCSFGLSGSQAYKTIKVSLKLRIRYHKFSRICYLNNFIFIHLYVCDRCWCNILTQKEKPWQTKLAIFPRPTWICEFIGVTKRSMNEGYLQDPGWHLKSNCIIEKLLQWGH